MTNTETVATERQALQAIKDRLQSAFGAGVWNMPSPNLNGASRWEHQQAALFSIIETCDKALREASRTQSPAECTCEMLPPGFHMDACPQHKRAASIPAPERSVGVMVKRLEWKPFTSDEDVSFMFAAAFGVRYEVFHKASDVAKIGIQVARMQHVDSLLSDDDGEETTTIIGYGKDLAAAYAIAQADFDTLVLSALAAPAPVPVPVTITPEMIERAAIGIYEEAPSIGLDCECGWRDQTPQYKQKARMIARAALTAALSKPGEQG